MYYVLTCSPSLDDERGPGTSEVLIEEKLKLEIHGRSLGNAVVQPNNPEKEDSDGQPRETTANRETLGKPEYQNLDRRLPRAVK